MRGSTSEVEGSHIHPYPSISSRIHPYILNFEVWHNVCPAPSASVRLRGISWSHDVSHVFPTQNNGWNHWNHRELKSTSLPSPMPPRDHWWDPNKASMRPAHGTRCVHCFGRQKTSSVASAAHRCPWLPLLPWLPWFPWLNLAAPAKRPNCCEHRNPAQPMLAH